MHHPTQHTPASEAARTALIEEAEAATGILPPHATLVGLEERLRAEIQAAVDIVRIQADRLNRGTTDWYQRDCALAEARHATEEGLGAGLRSAAVHVARLGRCLRILDTFVQVKPKA
ncbi:DUF6415 family natural product biosynthesis protein [Streptomyces sp. KL116D]|uniref:DUF6415 family natural product biosynthesis protein n=1 Tax=Streptomyces sp. KL116D TaxID=3045152 RepID=UPI0035586B45